MSIEQPDIDLEDWDALWETFETADYESRIVLFQQAVTTGMTDGEMAFEMLNELYPEAVEREERARFDQLVADLREQAPEAYASEAAYLLDWLITNALAGNRSEDILRLGQEMAQIAGQNVEVFTMTLDQLAYHGQLPALVAMMEQAWPLINRSEEILELTVEELAIRATNYVIFYYLEQAAMPDAHDPQLLTQLARYGEIEPDELGRYLAQLTGQQQRQWQASDFVLPPDETVTSATGESLNRVEQNLAQLSTEFLGYLHHTENVDYSKGALAQWQLPDYLQQRLQAPPRGPRSKSKRKRPPKPFKRIQPHPLCPERGSLESFLGSLLNPVSPQPYHAVVTFELIPAWLRFLETRQLISTAQRERTLSDLKDIDALLLKAWQLFVPGDPILRHNIEQWRQDAGVGGASDEPI